MTNFSDGGIIPRVSSLWQVSDYFWCELSFFGHSAHQGSLVFGPFRLGLRKTKPQDLSDVMNHAVQCPLNVDLYLPSKRKTIHSLSVLNICEHWFRDHDPLVIDISSSL